MATDTPDTAKALDDIRREVVEARNMTIKTDNALKTLSAELKHVAQTQEGFRRRSWFATGAAYLGFVGLCVAGVVAILNASTAAERADRERLERQAAELSAQLDRQKTETAAALAAERAAGEVYKLMTALPGEERLKGLDALARVDQSRLSPFARQVLQDRAALLKKEVGAGILERGKAAFRKQDYASAIEELSRFMALSPTGDEALEASFFLGSALVQTRKFDEAVKHLSRYVEGDKKARVRDFAMLLLMQSYEVLGQKDRSLEVAREAVATYPASEYRTQFLTRAQRKDAPLAAPAPPPAPAPAYCTSQ